MQHANASHLSPVLAVGRKGDVLVGVEQPARHAIRGAVGEDQVVVLHDLSGCVGRGGNEDRHRAEVKQHERTIAVGEVLEGSVWERAKLKKIS